MILFILGIIVLVVGAGALLFATEPAAKIGGAVLGLLLGGGLIFFSSMYTQEVGEAKVIKNFDGTIAREDVSPGLDFKAPWQDAVDFDILAQQAIYKGNGSATSEGEVVNGPEISAQDKDGVSSNIDVAVRYSIKPDSVSEIFGQYKSQEAFVARLIDQDIRSVVRNVPSGYSTVDVLAKRAELETKIVDALKDRWEKQGVQVDSVALQGIRYPQVVQDRFTEAQNAKTQVVQEQAKLDAVKISAQQRIVEAEAEAAANRLKSDSLTDKILQNNYIDALKNAKYLIAGDSNTMLQLPAPQ